MKSASWLNLTAESLGESEGKSAFPMGAWCAEHHTGLNKSWTSVCPIINNKITPRGAKSISWACCWCRCGELLLEVGLGDQKCSLLPCLRFLLSSQHGCSGLCSLTATYPSSFNIFAVLQFLKCLVWKACEQCVSIIQLRCNESMNDSLAPSWDSLGCSLTYYPLQM